MLAIFKEMVANTFHAYSNLVETHCCYYRIMSVMKLQKEEEEEECEWDMPDENDLEGMDLCVWVTCRCEA